MNQEDSSLNVSTMFSKGKPASKVLEHNVILQKYDVGRLYGSGGPEGAWKIYEGCCKTDGKVNKLIFLYKGYAFFR